MSANESDVDSTSKMVMKLELVHDDRNEDADVNRVEQRVKQLVNHPTDRITDIRLAVGPQASSIFVTLKSRKWAEESLSRLASSVLRNLKSTDYAGNIRLSNDWRLDVD